MKRGTLPISTKNCLDSLRGKSCFVLVLFAFLFLNYINVNIYSVDRITEAHRRVRDTNILKILQPIDLNTELRESGLSDEQIEKIPTYSKGLYTIYEFLDTLPDSTSEGGYSLGLTAYMDIYQVLTKVSNLTLWEDKYRKLWGDVTARTAEFLDIITQEGKPIVFFVPRNIFKVKVGRVTAEEVKWFLSHLDRMENVYFVFGAYETITVDDYKDARLFPLSLYERIKVMINMFRNYREYMKR